MAAGSNVGNGMMIPVCALRKLASLCFAQTIISVVFLVHPWRIDHREILPATLAAYVGPAGCFWGYSKGLICSCLLWPVFSGLCFP